MCRMETMGVLSFGECVHAKKLHCAIFFGATHNVFFPQNGGKTVPGVTKQQGYQAKKCQFYGYIVDSAAIAPEICNNLLEDNQVDFQLAHSKAAMHFAQYFVHIVFMASNFMQTKAIQCVCNFTDVYAFPR